MTSKTEECESCKISVGTGIAVILCKELNAVEIDCNKAMEKVNSGELNPFKFINELKTVAKNKKRMDIVKKLEHLEVLMREKSKSDKGEE